MTVRRGHIHLVRLPGVDEQKAALVVSADAVSEFLKPVAVQVTSTKRLRTFPTFVLLRKGEGGLSEDSYALCHELHTLNDEHIDGEPLGEMIPFSRLVEVERAISHALDLDAAA